VPATDVQDPGSRAAFSAKAGDVPRFRVVDYAIILKPNVMSLVVFTALVGLLLAPGEIAPWRAAVAVLCIALGAGAAGRHQHVVRPRHRLRDEPYPRPADSGRPHAAPYRAVLWNGPLR